jgi:protein archease
MKRANRLRYMLSCYISPTGRRYAFFGQHGKTGVVGYGGTIEKAFEGAAAAMFALIADPSSVRIVRTIPVSFIERDTGIALVRWLDLLLKAAQDEKLVFSEFSIEREGALWRGCAAGEPSLRVQYSVDDNIARAKLGSVKQRGTLWEARCVMREHTTSANEMPRDHHALVPV